MNRRTTFAVVATCALLAAAAPAWGHADFEEDSVPPDAEAVLNLKVPVEPPGHGDEHPDLAARHNDRVTLEIPEGFTAVACEAKPGWDCAVNPEAGRTPHHVAYDRSGGPNDPVDVFGLTVRTPRKTGTYVFEVNQTYSDGDTAHWDGDPDSDNPGATVDVE